jgi:hypothetical protein
MTIDERIERLTETVERLASIQQDNRARAGKRAKPATRKTAQPLSTSPPAAQPAQSAQSAQPLPAQPPAAQPRRPTAPQVSQARRMRAYWASRTPAERQEYMAWVQAQRTPAQMGAARRGTQPRCPCGEMTFQRAEARRHKCTPAGVIPKIIQPKPQPKRPDPLARAKKMAKAIARRMLEKGHHRYGE